jgi:hypothetical protein
MRQNSKKIIWKRKQERQLKLKSNTTMRRAMRRSELTMQKDFLDQKGVDYIPIHYKRRRWRQRRLLRVRGRRLDMPHPDLERRSNNSLAKQISHQEGILY